ncbi:MAG: YbfB/YjiJ family MFS transporter, partial [Rubrivivax sp.]|nr:YbfB/YjiJ family MFS transporter [Rubrivivax sp.]
PHHAAALIGLITAAYGLGQIAGPPLVAVLVQQAGDAATGFAWSLQTAAAALVLGAAIFGGLSRVRP